MHDVTLISEFGPVRLDGAPVGLKGWPSMLDGYGASLAWDDHSGAFREHLPGGVQTGEMTLIVKGRHVGREVSALLDSLRWGEGGVLIQVQSHGAETRTMTTHLKEVGEITWYPEPRSTMLAEVPLRFEYPPYGWEGETTTTVLSDVSGRVVVPYAGDLEEWPELSIKGSVKVQLRDTDPVLELPAGEYTVLTNPRQRGVFVKSGEPFVSGVVPFWPAPPRKVPGGLELFVTANGPGNTVEVKLTERWSKSWL